MARKASLMLSAGQTGKGSGIPTVQVVHAGAEKMLPAEKDFFVAIPLLPVGAATPGEGRQDRRPRTRSYAGCTQKWRPNPASTISLLVKGSSRSPLILVRILHRSRYLRYRS